MNLVVTVHHEIALDPDLKEILQAFSNAVSVDHSTLARIEQKVDTLIMDDTLVIAALKKIDDATTKIAANDQIIADNLQVVATDQDALLEALKNAGTSPALIAQAESVATRVQAASDFMDTQVPVLQAIAAKGHTNPVPTPVPEPPVVA